MHARNCFCGLALILVLVPAVMAAAPKEKLRNDRVLVTEQALAPCESRSLPADRPSVLVYLDTGSIELTPAGGKPRTETVQRGQAVFQPAQSGTLKNTGSSDLRIVSVEYLGKGGSETWGNAGLSPNYQVLFENQYGRVYDIRVAAGRTEPLHTHHDRVVVCLSGAQLDMSCPMAEEKPLH